MTYLLDTDILSLYQRNHRQVVASIASHAQDTLCVSTVSIEEQISGWSAIARNAKTQTRHEYASLVLLNIVSSLSSFGLVPFTIPAIQRFEQLLKSRLNITGNDLRIAAIALELGATVVTRNRRDFLRVPGVPIEDWSV